LRLRVEVLLAAPSAAVWEAVRDIESHVEWMTDARAITFTSPTTFDCLTVVGPFRMVDRMEVVSWDEGRTMGIRHVGVVRGEGRFILTPAGEGTLFTWDERLTFPWWLGGPVGAAMAKPVLRRIWRRNLANLRALLVPST
jgi:carbon monoxide dehydrogenase subunit G